LAGERTAASLVILPANAWIAANKLEPMSREGIEGTSVHFVAFARKHGFFDRKVSLGAN
jgi:hypothetical protein